jgi:lipoate---protein ligase
MTEPPAGLSNPSRHAEALAGLDLMAAGRPGITVLAAREVVVVLPRSRDPEREVYLDRCAADGVPLVVRPSGGGAVLLAPGIVVASLLIPMLGEHGPDPWFERCCGRVTAALTCLGTPGAVRRGISDICLGDRKVAGSSLRLMREAVLFQVSVLVDVELALIDRYLPQPSREPTYRAGRNHGQFLTTLRKQGFRGSGSDVEQSLMRHLGKLLPLAARPGAEEETR